MAMEGPPFRLAIDWIRDSLASQAKDILWIEKRLGMSIKEPPPTEGSEVANEESLLTIRSSACWDYVDCCRKLHGVGITPAFPRSEGTVPAEQVAALVQECREAIRAGLEPSGFVRRIKKFIARKRRALGSLLSSPSAAPEKKRNLKQAPSTERNPVSDDDGAIR